MEPANQLQYDIISCFHFQKNTFKILPFKNCFDLIIINVKKG